MEVKGFCEDCLWIKQDWTLDWTKKPNGDLQLYLVQETYCFLCDIFKSLTGYCDMWEQDEQKAKRESK